MSKGKMETQPEIMRENVFELFQCLGFAGALQITERGCKARQRDANRGRLDYPSTKACLTCSRHPKHEQYRRHYAKVRKAWQAQERREKRTDGRCPICGERQRRAFNSGRIATYCDVCAREQARADKIFKPVGG